MASTQRSQFSALFALVALLGTTLEGVRAQGTNATCLPGFEWVRALYRLNTSQLSLTRCLSKLVDVQLKRTVPLFDHGIPQHTVSGESCRCDELLAFGLGNSRLSDGFADAYVYSLPTGFHYRPPIPSTATACQCNTIFYSVIQACAVCQGDPIVP